MTQVRIINILYYLCLKYFVLTLLVPLEHVSNTNHKNDLRYLSDGLKISPSNKLMKHIKHNNN